MAYEDWLRSEKRRKQEQPEQPADTGSQDIRQYMKRKRDDEDGNSSPGVQAAIVDNRAGVDSKFIFAVLSQNLCEPCNTSSGSDEDIADESESLFSQRSWWIRYFQELTEPWDEEAAIYEEDSEHGDGEDAYNANYNDILYHMNEL